MKDSIFIALSFLLILLLQTTVFPMFVSYQYKPDLFLILILWTWSRTGLIGGAVFAFISGLVVESFSGAPSGLFAGIYLVVFLLLVFLDSIFEMHSQWLNAIVLFCACLVAGYIVLLVSWFAIPFEFGWDFLKWPFLKALSTSLFSVILVPILDRLWHGYSNLMPARLD